MTSCVKDCSIMATPTNGAGNLVDEFEEAYLSIMQVLAKEEENFNTFEKDETRMDIEQASLKFLDIARQLESFFLQKRFVLSALKPELILKEEILELKAELQRKDDLLKRHYEKINYWQNLLSDVRSQAPLNSQTAGLSPQVPSAGPSGIGPTGGASPNPALMSALQQQVQQQQQQMQLQQQQHIQQQQQQQQQLQQQLQQQMSAGMPGNGAPGPGNVGPMLSSQQAMFMQQQGIGQRPPFPSPGPGNLLAGPLAYLEKTTSNIGMPDGRR